MRGDGITETEPLCPHAAPPHPYPSPQGEGNAAASCPLTGDTCEGRYPLWSTSTEAPRFNGTTMDPCLRRGLRNVGSQFETSSDRPVSGPQGRAACSRACGSLDRLKPDGPWLAMAEWRGPPFRRSKKLRASNMSATSRQLFLKFCAFL